MQSIAEKDLGTPAPRWKNVGLKTSIAEPAHKTVTLNIEGQECTVAEGTSVMRAAALAGISIPKLCATDQLEAFGSCRLCLVQIDGMRGYPASCTTPVAPGMKVTTQNAKLAELRRGVMELYISDHPLDCLTCPANGHCELQDMAGAVGLREVRYGYEGDNHVHARRNGEVNERFVAKDESNPYFT
ncbi:MAG TPA: 2Fe-2S iron-sulfur cluster-binding protein, partial [Pseudolabrys sp.]